MVCAQIFLEETSLVARPAVEFPDLKERLDARMKWLGIKVSSGWGAGMRGIHSGSQKCRAGKEHQHLLLPGRLLVGTLSQDTHSYGTCL